MLTGDNKTAADDIAHTVGIEDVGGDFSPYRSLLATGAILFKRGDFRLKAGARDDKTRWLLGGRGRMPCSRRKPDTDAAFRLRQAFPQAAI